MCGTKSIYSKYVCGPEAVKYPLFGGIFLWDITLELEYRFITHAIMVSYLLGSWHGSMAPVTCSKHHNKNKTYA